MRAFGQHDPSRSHTIGHAHSTSTKTSWMDLGAGAGLAPNVWLVRMPPGSEIGSHFHTQNQFQVFVEGRGRIGAHTVAPVTVHYAGAFTGYGPLVAGPEGLAYFTIRGAHDPGAQYLPAAREQLAKGPKQAWTGPVFPRVEAALDEMTFRHEVDGPSGSMSVETRTVGPGSSFAFRSSPGAGRFLFLLAGSIDAAGRHLSAWGCLFATPDEGSIAVYAASTGAQLLLLQMPLLNPAYEPVPPACMSATVDAQSR